MGLITDIIKGLPIAAVLEDKLKDVEKKFEALQTENEALREENKKLKEQSATLTTLDYVEVEGLLWKRKASGGFESKPRCPICTKHPVLFEFPPNMSLHWNCPVCNGIFDYADSPQE